MFVFVGCTTGITQSIGNRTVILRIGMKKNLENLTWLFGGGLGTCGLHHKYRVIMPHSRIYFRKL